MQAIFVVMSTTSRAGLNYFQVLFFHYCLSSFHSCEDRFHIPCFIRSSPIWFLYIYSQKLRQLALKLTLLFTVANTNQEKK